MKIKTTVEIADDLVISILDSAFAYCSFWKSCTLVSPGSDKDNAFAGHVMSGGVVKIVVDKDSGFMSDIEPSNTCIDQDQDTATFQLDRGAVQRGLQELANSERYRRRFAEIIEDHTDAITGHVLIQFALFGCVVFD